MVTIGLEHFVQDRVQDALPPLRATLTGELLTADSPDYEVARKVDNFLSDRRPLAIARVANAEDVATAVTFARVYGLPLAVRSGGHSVGLHSVIDGAIVVDLSEMKRVVVDPEARTARVQGGATSADIAGPAHEYGLALSTGDTASVGIGGLTTGGGVGLMVRKYGLTIDNLLEAQVVTANGEILTASPVEHPDLFWAIRGGGGNFGIVTEFVFRLAPVDQVLGGMLILPGTREVIRGYLDASAAAPDDLTTIANLIKAPPMPFLPAEVVGTPVLAILVSWTGDVDAGDRALAPLRALAEPLADLIRPMPYPALYELGGPEMARFGASVRSMFADDLSDSALDAALTAVGSVTSSGFGVVQLRGLGGAFAQVDTDATAFAHRNRRYYVAIARAWFDPSDDPSVHRAWTESLWEIFHPEGSGVYVNFLGNEGADRVREAYPEGTYERLQEIKRRYDPDNIFRFNQNIPPKE